ncbi:GNAT family N-acetyltransferase [Saccharopolyspora shandongensis]|uniref:GNAT family N-acetyltransferase n=1 Tax=Saccharopolyspora shandongensis TaxID=418495 RepID=UPI0033F9C360
MSSFWTGRLVRLRGIEPEDWRAFMRMDSHSEHQRSADALYPPRSADGYRTWTAEQSAAQPVDDSVRLVIEALDSGVLVGSVSTHDADPRTGRFSHGVAIDDQYQRRGYASEAVVLLLRFMFGERRYHKCEAQIYADNEASLALHRTLGFIEEGLLREHEFFAGRHHDMAVLGVTAPEFAELHGLGEAPSGNRRDEA